MELGRLMATAFHAPEDLDKLLTPTVREAHAEAKADEGAWDTDEWWKAQAT
jgi:hypothetical protein